MALQAIDLETTVVDPRHARSSAAGAATAWPLPRAVPRPTPVLAPLDAPELDEQVATITPMPRMVALAAARRERRRWFFVGALVFATPFAACLGILEVVR